MVSRWVLRKCTKCGAYTLNKVQCPKCGGPVRVPHPPKFSPEDRYGRYRRMLKRQSGVGPKGSSEQKGN